MVFKKKAGTPKQSRRIRRQDPFGEPGVEKGKRKYNKETGKLKKTVNYYNFKKPIYAVLKQTHPDMRIGTKGMSIMNSFIVDIFERIASEASKLSQLRKKKIVMMSSHDIQTAVRLVLNGELAKHAVSEGTKALSLYQKSKQ